MTRPVPTLRNSLSILSVLLITFILNACDDSSPPTITPTATAATTPIASSTPAPAANPTDTPEGGGDSPAPTPVPTLSDAYRKLPNRDLSNLTPHELDLICEVVGRPHFSMSNSVELYFDRLGQLVFDINTGRTRDTWPYREALRHECSSTP